MEFFIGICEDEKESLEWIKQAVLTWADKNSHRVKTAAYQSAEGFLFEYEENRVFDILLLDVEMAGMSGLDLAKHIRQRGCRAEIIFITSHFEFCGEGYEVDALHYLVKPVSIERLYTVLDRAAGKLTAEERSVIITCGKETFKLLEQDILYIEAFLHYITIYTAQQEYKIKENLSSFAERLSGIFYRAHRSYLVSLKHIVRISRTQLWLDNGAQLPLARGKYDDINQAFIQNN